MDAAEDVYKATPQTKGTIAHRKLDEKKSSTRKDYIMSLPVCSDELGISGKIDVYKQDLRLLVERKNNLRNVFRGQVYQLWGQYFCMIEMGYQVERLAFYEISTNKMTEVALPGEQGKREILSLLQTFKTYDPLTTYFKVNSKKCAHCIYCNLCDKTTSDNVYT